MQLLLNQQNKIKSLQNHFQAQIHDILSPVIPHKNISTVKVILLTDREVDLFTIICSEYKLFPACTTKQLTQDRNLYLCVLK